MHWQTARFVLDLQQPQVMGIVNLTPDSFSDGGQLPDARSALRHAERLLREGAAVLDLGAESSRPGAARVDEDEEWRRLQPVLAGALRLGVPVSVDSCKPGVMARALDLGADAINDIQALREPAALAVLAAHPRAGVALMHMRGQPGTMQQRTDYADVALEVRDFLAERLASVHAAGVARARVVLDPGFGFAKTPAQNLALAQALPALAALGAPLLVGWSRKSTLGWLTGTAVAERLPASLAAALAAVQAGARLLRVHDVAATVQAVQVWQALCARESAPN